MVKYTVAFDVDGTLRNIVDESIFKPNERIRTLLVTLCSFKNVKVIVWSARGADYAKEVVRELGLYPYIKNRCYLKGDIEVDIAIDDQHSMELGKMNLIVNELGHKPKEPSW